jgi:UDP-3-O-[3-hydroxymyristoyl] N-acetylglucosamine deacetylase/3-hydroxyacyl-[acyl-carrier-protein] dehydratase
LSNQRTIARETTLTGPGLFSGEPATLTFTPAGPDEGITFVRESANRSASIPAHVRNVLARPRRTCLRNGTLHVETVEHCLAALTGLGIHNVAVRVESERSGELPMADGSSKPFAEKLLEAGIVAQSAPLKPLVIRAPVQINSPDGKATIAALPGPTDHLDIVYEFEAPPPVGKQVLSFKLGHDETSGESFMSLIAPARTFVFEAEARALVERGWGKHLSPKELLVIGPRGPVENEFRFVDECVRHKILDLIGDLSLVGRPIAGRIIATKSGHELNHLMARRLLEQEVRFERRDLLRRDAALDIRKIQRILPHRYPMLLIDRVLEVDTGDRAVGLKNVTFNDVFFQGHYPGTPIFPGVLIVEAMAQLGGILLSQKLEHTGKLAVLLSMDKVKMRHPVVPGDQLILEARSVRVRARMGHVRCQAFVGETLAAEADIKFMLVDAEPS